jgi:hypothetical protein
MSAACIRKKVDDKLGHAKYLTDQIVMLLGSHGTSTSMTNSYLGIITLRGLESLVVETAHAAPFSFRRAELHDDEDAVCCWAVLDDRAAKNVRRPIASHRFDEALQLPNLRAQHLGTVVSPDDDEDLVRAYP